MKVQLQLLCKKKMMRFWLGTVIIKNKMGNSWLSFLLYLPNLATLPLSHEATHILVHYLRLYD